MANSSAWGVNEQGEIVAVAGTGTTNIVGYINEDILPVDNQGRLVIVGLGGGGGSGIDGKTIRYGTVAPTNVVGNNGDFYINTATNMLYGPKNSTWPAGVSLVGPQGIQGAQGATGPQGATGATGATGTNGVDGKTLRYGSVAPTSGFGNDGDFYINTATNYIYGPKASGAWPAGTSMIGPQGAAGTGGSVGGVTTAAFSTVVPLTTAGTTFMSAQTVSSVLSFSPAASPVQGALTYVRLSADGVNAPTFSGMKEWNGSSGYDNRNGIINVLQFFYDGVDVWYSIAQAVGATPIIVATALTLSLSNASIVVGNPVTVTVGVNNPLTGSQSESVSLTAPVAGSWSVNPVTLNASTQSTTSTFTPSATGSGNITAAATGTPTVTGASQAFASTSAATVPGAPTIGTAVAGDGYVDVAFTAPASNGGATITSYTATLSTGETNTGTTSPIRVTAANGPARTAHVTATNSVGTGAASAESNSVTPVAASAATAARFSQLTGITETGTASDYTYTGASSAAGYSSQNSLSTQGLQAGVDGSMEVTMRVRNNDGFIFGMTTSSTPVAYGSLAYAIYASINANQYKVITAGGIAIAPTVVQILAGDRVRMRRVGTTLYAEVMVNGGNTWTVINTWTNVPTSAYKFDLMFSGTCAAGAAAGVGLA